MKNGTEPTRARRWSLAGTLTAYYAGSAFLIVLLATGYLYWAMVRNVDLEDDRLLADRIRLVEAILRRVPLDTAALEQEVNESWQAGQRTQVFIRVADSNGNVICESRGMDDLLPASSFPAATSKPDTGHDLKSPAGQSQRVMALRIDGESGVSISWLIHVGMDRGEEDEILADYRENLFYVLVAALVVCTIAGYRIARRGIRPISQITQAAGNTRPSNLGERIATSGLPDELHRLADTFNAMLDRLERAFDRLTGFTADIAHELRTPVNNLRGELDVALEKRRAPEEYEEIIGSSLEECGRISRIIDSLLFLARAENPQTQIERERIDVRQELENIRDFFEPAAQEAGVRLENASQGTLDADLNRALFQQAVGNLVTNAIAHTPAGGNVTVQAECDGPALVVEVVDSGSGIPAAHLPHVFDRFYRADHSRATNDGGVGLGLAIVKTIVDLHGGSVDLTSEVAHGTKVRLRFPMRFSPEGNSQPAKMTKS